MTMASDDNANDETYNKEYRRLKTLTSQTDIVESSVSFAWLYFQWFLTQIRIPFPLFKQLLMGFPINRIILLIAK